MPDEIKTIVGKHCLEADCLLMGANTYTYIFEHWGGWPYKSQRSFVVSHHDANLTPDCGVEFLTEEPLRKVYELKQTHDILVVGGGKWWAKASALSGKHSALNGSCRKVKNWMAGLSVQPTCLRDKRCARLCSPGANRWIAIGKTGLFLRLSFLLRE